MTVTARIAELDRRIETFWRTAQAFLDNRDAHGLMDMGAELQALQRARAELFRIDSPFTENCQTFAQGGAPSA